MKRYKVINQDCELQVYSINPSHAKTAILFLHGGPGSGAKAIMDLPPFQILGENYHCLYFDQRGSGNSIYDLRKGLTIDMITQDVFTVVKDAKERWHIERLFLWGGSFGGYLASLCLQRNCHEFNGAILSSPAITFNRQQSLEFYRRMRNQYQTRLNFQLLEDLAPEIFLADPKIKQFILSDQNPSQSLRHICAMSSWFYQYTFKDMFKEIKIPILIMQGKDDSICNYEYLDENIKKSHNHQIIYYLYEHCGHEVFNDQERAFIKNIENFIRRI